MSEFISLVLFGACWTWGFSCPFQEGYIFEKIGNKMWDNWPEWVCKPLFACPPCMASIHGFGISAVYFDFHIYPMLAYIVCLCGLNFIVKSLLYPEYE